MSTHRARKSLGQNFLVDTRVQRRIVEALDPDPHDTIIEIGPGKGALSRHLAGTAAKLILIELDRDLAPALKAEYADRPDITVIEADVLDVDLRDLVTGSGTVKIVGNIPYNITTPIIFHLLDREIRPERIVLMVQREVADRIVADPGSREYGALSVGVRTVARVERLFNVPRGAFRPVPGVDSTVIGIAPFRPPPLDADEETDLRTLTRVAFSMRRKQLQKILRASPDYALEPDDIVRIEQRTGITLEQRPEQLDPQQFVALSRELRQIQSQHTAGEVRS